jgi:amino acid transporter
MSTVRRPIAIASLILGLALTVASLVVMFNVWKTLDRFRSEPSHDTYFVMPGAEILLVYALGLAASMVYRSRSRPFEAGAVLVWCSHLVVTSMLLLVALFLTQPAPTLAVLMLLAAILPVMLLAHGMALTAGAVLVLRANRQG